MAAICPHWLGLVSTFGYLPQEVTPVAVTCQVDEALSAFQPPMERRQNCQKEWSSPNTWTIVSAPVQPRPTFSKAGPSPSLAPLHTKAMWSTWESLGCFSCTPVQIRSWRTGDQARHDIPGRWDEHSPVQFAAKLSNRGKVLTQTVNPIEVHGSQAGKIKRAHCAEFYLSN